MTITWFIVALALLGNIGVILKRRWGFACWILSNAYLIAHNAAAADWPQAALFTAYLALALWGFIKWARPASPAENHQCRCRSPRRSAAPRHEAGSNPQSPIQNPK